jgi:hypothetical protein
MTSQEYLLSQAEYCRRRADESIDRFVAQELERLAREFEEKARAECVGPARTLKAS